MRRPAFFLLAAVPLLMPGVTPSAQTPNVSGVVRDSAGRPIAAAEVRAASRSTRSDTVGRFSLSVPLQRSITLSVRRMGYESVTFTVTAEEAAGNDIDIVLQALPHALPEVKVEGPSLRRLTPLIGFDERRAQGIGVFLTREEIEKRNRYLLSEVLRTQRGVTIQARQGRKIVRFATRAERGCEALIWVDGQPAPMLDVDAIPASNVEAVELYQSIATTPAEFIRTVNSYNCGTVVIWTKRPILEKR